MLMTDRILCLILFCQVAGFSVPAAEVIQIDVRSVLTGRAVTTLTDGKLKPWTKGVDGGGRAGGVMRFEASPANGDKDALALPGDGCFKATTRHPFVRLNFSNADGKGFQTRGVEGEGGFDFP